MGVAVFWYTNKKLFVEQQNPTKVYKKNVNFTRLFSIVCQWHKMKYLLFEWNFTNGRFCWIPSFFCRSLSLWLPSTNITLPHCTSVPIVMKCPAKLYKPNIFQTLQHNHFLCCLFNSTVLLYLSSFCYCMWIVLLCVYCCLTYFSCRTAD